MTAAGTPADEIAIFPPPSRWPSNIAPARPSINGVRSSPSVCNACKAIADSAGRGSRLCSNRWRRFRRSGIRAGVWNGFDPEAVAIARAKGTEEDQARSFESFDARTREETDALLALGRGFRNPYARLHALTVAANDLQYRHGAFRDALSVWNEIDALAERNGAVAWQAQALNQRALIEIALGDLARANQTEQEANALLTRLGPGRRPELFSMEMATARACYLGGEFAELADFWIVFADDPALGPGESASLLGPFFAAVGRLRRHRGGRAGKSQRHAGRS